MKSESALTNFEIIDAKTLAERWHVTHSWVRKQTCAAEGRIPHIRLGRYVRFAWGSPDLCKWLENRYQK